MKNLLLFCVVIISFGRANAQQGIVVKTDTIWCNGMVSDSLLTGEDFFTNQTGATQRFTWVRTENNLPQGWGTSVCDANNCYPTTTSTDQLSVANEVFNNTQTFISVEFFVTSPGTGSVTIKYFGNNTDTVYAWFVATANPTGINNVSVVNDLLLYPSPASSNLFVAYNSSFRPNKIEIYNVLGQIVKTVTVQPGNAGKANIGISELDKGVYFTRIYSSNSANIITKQFTKQ